MISSAFTCTGSYAVLIMLGIKRVENRSMMPVPARGRCAVGCSKSFCKEEYGKFVQWAAQALPEEDFERIPCRGNVGMWQMPSALAAQVTAADVQAQAAGVQFLDQLILGKDFKFAIINSSKENRQ